MQVVQQLAQVVLISMQEVHGSNLGQDTILTGLSWYSSILPSKSWKNSILN
jgi:hypothetical protein